MSASKLASFFLIFWDGFPLCLERRLTRAAILGILLLVGVLLSDEQTSFASQSEFDLDGRLQLELDSTDRFRRVDFNRIGQLDLKVSTPDGLSGNIDLKISDDSRGVDLRSLFLEYKAIGGLRFLIGQSKKRFGLEADQGMQDRIRLTHGAIYKKLSSLSYIGRDPTLGIQFGDQGNTEGPRLIHRLSAHSSEGLNAGLLYQLSYRLREGREIESYTLIQRDRFIRYKLYGFAQAFAFKGEWSRFRLAVEGLGGRNSFESNLNRLVGNESDVYFAAASFSAARRFKHFEPLLGLAALFHDIAQPSERTLEFTLGTRYHLTERAYLGAELNWAKTGSRQVALPEFPFDSTSSFLMVARYFF